MLPFRMLATVLLSIIAAALLPLPGFEVDARAQDPAPQVSISPAGELGKTPEYGAIAFAPDGSFFSVWKIESRLEAEEKVRTECAAIGRFPVTVHGPAVFEFFLRGRVDRRHLQDR